MSHTYFFVKLCQCLWLFCNTYYSVRQVVSMVTQTGSDGRHSDRLREMICQWIVVPVLIEVQQQMQIKTVFLLWVKFNKYNFKPGKNITVAKCHHNKIASLWHGSCFRIIFQGLHNLELIKFTIEHNSVLYKFLLRLRIQAEVILFKINLGRLFFWKSYSFYENYFKKSI